MISNPIDFSVLSSLNFLLKVSSRKELLSYVWANVFQVGSKSKKLCMRKHKRYLGTNNILRWKTLHSKLSFFEGVMFCSIFCYSNMTLTKLNSIAFLFSCSSSGDCTRLSGYYFSYEVTYLFKKDKLKFLKGYHNIVSDKELLKYLLSRMSGFSDSLPYNWKRPPWKTRKKGSMQRLDFYYSDKVVVFNLIRDMVLKNKSLFMPLLDLIKNYIPTLYCSAPIKVNRCLLEKRENVNFVWNDYYRQELLLHIFSSLPLCYWSIYSHLISDISMRKSLLLSSSSHLVSSSNRALMTMVGDGNFYYKVTAKNLDSLAGGYVKRGDYY